MTASPIGDGAPVLLALDASVTLASAAGRRDVPLREFFLAYRKTAARPGEVLIDVRVPRGRAGDPALLQGEQARPRRHLHRRGRVRARPDAGRTRGAARGSPTAASPRRRSARPRSRSALRRPAVDAGRRPRRCASIADGVGTPMTDLRGSAAYRRAMVGRLLEKCVADTAPRASRWGSGDEQAGRADRDRARRRRERCRTNRRRPRHRRGALRRRPVARRGARRACVAGAWRPTRTRASLRDRRRPRARTRPACSPCSPPTTSPARTTPVRRATTSRCSRREVCFAGQAVAWVIAETRRGRARAAAAAVARRVRAAAGDPLDRGRHRRRQLPHRRRIGCIAATPRRRCATRRIASTASCASAARSTSTSRRKPRSRIATTTAG